MPMKTEEQKKTVQSKVSDKTGEKCAVGCRIYLIEQGTEKRCTILQKGERVCCESSES